MSRMIFIHIKDVILSVRIKSDLLFSSLCFFGTTWIFYEHVLLFFYIIIFKVW